MLSKKFTAVAGASEVTDDYFKNTTLLLSGDGTNGAQNNGTANPFLDSSTANSGSGWTITRNGNTTQGSYSPYGSLWSNYFDGDGSALTFPTNTAFAFGTGDVTIEAWIFDAGTTAAYGQIIGASTYGVANDFVFSFNGSTKTLFFQFGSSGGSSSTGTVSSNTWTHVAVVRNGSTVTFYINGVSGGSYTDSDNVSSSIAPTIGTSSNNNSDARFKGYISNLRITKGGALYTSSFTPSTTPLTTTVSAGTVSLLTCQSNRFIDNSSNAFAITVGGTPSVQRFSPFNPTTAYSTATIGGSGYFDGSGDYLSCGSQSAYAFGTGLFTIEAWVYVTSRAAEYNIAATRGAAGSANGWSLSIVTSGGVTFYTNGYVFNNSGTVPLNAWTHIAITREGTGSNQTKLYINGVSTATTTNSQDFSNTTLAVGASNDGSQSLFLGYISNFRMLKGTALTSFDLTTPLSPITNTSLLLNMTNAGIYDSAMMNDLETVGGAQISTSVKKYGTGSMYFDGSGDYLLVPMTSNIGIAASSPFTYECWVYLTAAQANYRMLSSDSGGTTTYIAVNSTGIEAQFGGLSSTLASCTYSFSTGTWYHLALVRNSSNAVVFYVNGIAQTMTNGTQSNAFLYQGASLYIGRWVGATPYEWYGYIDDFRITKGLARYTSNFTAPTAALPNY